MGAEQQNELTDVVLCYHAMGIPLDASPAAIERKYKALLDGYKKKIATADAAGREEIRVSMELLSEMYEKIRGSITYIAMEKEQEKHERTAKAAIKPVHDVVAQRALMMQCPRCNGEVVKGSEVCPICKTPIASGVKTFFTPVNVIVVAMVLALVAMVAIALFNPDLLSGIAGTGK
jgi:rubrerythrin